MVGAFRVGTGRTSVEFDAIQITKTNMVTGTEKPLDYARRFKSIANDSCDQSHGKIVNSTSMTGYLS